MKNSMEVLQKSKIRATCDPAILHLDIYLEEIKEANKNRRKQKH